MFKIFIPLLLLIFAVSCSVGPDYVKPPVEVPDSTFLMTDYTIEDSLAFALADTAWWELFGDTVLNLSDYNCHS